MCGISGIYNFDNKPVDSRLMVTVNDALLHRGPDVGNIAMFDNVALGHRRLKIIDLSESANQPMFSEDRKFAIVFNGEVYNFKELRKELVSLGWSFITDSDTEVVLKSFIQWGEKSFVKFNGMFALAIFNRQTGDLILARDQFGIKPLVYYKDSNRFVFASEKKAIFKHPEISLTHNDQALVEYLWYGNPLGSNTFYNEINELAPGHFLIVSGNNISIKKYFDVNEFEKIDIEEEEAIKQIKILFEKSIQRHLISDVPVGVFLSGGIDSSAITAFASKYYPEHIKTYSVGFDFIKGPNELAKAAKIAKKFKTDHHEIHISGANITNAIEKLVDSHDEPFGDAADIPLYLLTKKLKGDIKVVLQGDGGDEFFGGYRRYGSMSNLRMWKNLKPILKILDRFNFENQKILRFQRYLNAMSQSESYLRNALLLTVESKYYNPINVLNTKYREKLEYLNPFLRYKEIYGNYSNNIDSNQALFYTDTQIILKDTFFEKVDKATMANSMEVRVPFLDSELTSFMMRLPAELKTKKGVKKYLLKKALDGIIPDEILYGPKTGFSVPANYWLVSTLKEYFQSQISTDKVLNMLNVNEINKLFELHKRGKGNYGFLLWKVLILSIWLNKS